ncbi:ABC transporter substrate-binding protein [Ralstonia insidiosa]|uniref:ABC transporter substrate-binding protein n=1 Tax=Ralstonia TaxID=48736 RepID=UPI00066E7FF4|nr:MULTISPECIES: ABC transporter substrate-binding protein [Ralstonia]MBY4708084.1 ABC transporter substrate-binding protein [Ralstonia insidiosa]GAQ26544.1 extracellular ligand-binding receptor [Ralstonia sp. NT80]
MKITAAGVLLALGSTLAFAQASQPLKVVSSLDLSGPAANLGADSLAGFKFAIDAINQKGGVLGRQLAFDYQDNGTNAQRAVNQAGALAQQGAAVLMSPVSSGGTIAVTKAVSAKYKVPMCVSISAAEEITMKDYQPYMFSMAPTTYMLMRAVTTRLAKQPYKRYALVVPDYAGGRASALRFKEFLKELNPQAQIVVEEYPKLGATDYTATINKVLAAKPDYVWSQIYSGDLLTFSKQATALGFFKQINNRFMTVMDANTLKMLGDNAPLGIEGYQYAPFNYLGKSNEGKAFVTQYKAQNGSYPSDWAVTAYDCLTTWAQAANLAKSTDANAIVHAIEGNEFTTLRGPLRFGKFDHEAEVPVYFGKVVAGKEYGQPVLDIDAVVPASMTRPSQATVDKARKE